MAVTDIAVADTEAAHRSDLEVLPEHKRQWPMTPQVAEAVRRDYDGSMGTAKEIGNRFTGAGDAGAYPSWRIEQIARELGFADERLARLFAKVREEEDADKQGRVSRQGARVDGPATRKPPLALRTTPSAICEQCGQPFELWRKWKGRMATTRHCHACFVQRQRSHSKPLAPPPAPPVDPEPVERLIPVFPANYPDLKQPDGAAPVKLIDAPGYIRDDAGEQLTFGDLPGSGIVFELLDLLPTNGHWTERRRERWLCVLSATLDLLIECDGGSDGGQQEAR